MRGDTDTQTAERTEAENIEPPETAERAEAENIEPPETAETAIEAEQTSTSED